MESLRVKLRFVSCFSVDCVGRSGGLAVLWNGGCSCSILSYSNNHIDLMVTEDGVDSRVTGYYGMPDRSRRSFTWNLLRYMSQRNNMPWVVIGDFNDLLSSDKKKGGVDHPQWLFRGFQRAVEDCGISDVPLNGYRFTWFKSRGRPNEIQERLDRAMGNHD